MTHEFDTDDLSLSAAQRRLGLLGYDLGEELQSGIYGERTAAALQLFKQRVYLPESDVLDQATWAALLDASRALGERPLYLRMPHFVGHDVFVLQSALAALGFVCPVDWVFNPASESAVRDFQRNLLLSPDGIIDDQNVQALLRLRHAWEGKPGLIGDKRQALVVRDKRVLEQTTICVFGSCASTRSVADRVANLAQATTQSSRVISASTLGRPPDSSMLLVGLRFVEQFSDEMLEELSVTRPLRFCATSDSQARRLNLALLREDQAANSVALDEQRWAISVLDALCAHLARSQGATD